MLTACFTDLCHISCMFHAAILPHLFLLQAGQTHPPPLMPQCNMGGRDETGIIILSRTIINH